MNLYLKFKDEATANGILMRNEKNLFRNIDVIGVIYKNTGVFFPDEGGVVLHETQALDGWHVNVLITPEEDATALQPYVVTPANPVRVWG